MVARTTNFEGTLFYNPVAKGFNPVVSVTLISETTVDEGTALAFDVVAWNVPSNTGIFYRVESLTNLTADRFDTVAGPIAIVNNRGSFTITVDADNTTADGAQTYVVAISNTQNSPTLASSLITVNDTSQDPQLFVLDLDPKNYTVPDAPSTITVTTTFVNGAAGGFPNGGGGSYIRYNGTIPAQPSVGDTFVWSGTTYTIAQTMGAETYPPGQEQYYFIGFQPYYGGTIPIGTQLDISHAPADIITDASGQSNTGLLVGDIGIVNQGTDSAYFDFNMGGSYIEVPTLRNSAYRSMTMSLWFNSLNTSGSRSLIAKEIAYKMRLVDAGGGNSNLNVLAGWDGFSWLYNQIGTYAIQNTQWHHVAVTITPTQIAIYVDGQQVATATGVGALPANSQKLMIGSYGDGTSEFFTGSIGPARMYTYALTDQNIADYYTSSAGRYGVYAASYGSQTNPGSPVNQMVFQSVFTQDVTGQTISGYGCPAGVTVTQQTAIAGGTILTLSQVIDTFAVMYSFRPL